MNQLGEKMEWVIKQLTCNPAMTVMAVISIAGALWVHYLSTHDWKNNKKHC